MNRAARFLCALFSLCEMLAVGAGEKTPRQLVLEAMQKRPDDPWPRGRGHVVLAFPGTTEDFKAYHEPGGSFSPAFASFGISLWIADTAGNVIATSDSIPLDRVQQKLIWTHPQKPPGIETRTEFYRAVWFGDGLGHWKVVIEPEISEAQRLMLVVRSVGPAGGEIRSMGWDYKTLQQKLAVNDRWVISFNRRLPFEIVAPNGRARLVDAHFTDMAWNGEENWGFARFNLPQDKPTEISVRDFEVPPPGSLKFSEVRARLNLRLPDRDFTNCLNAQVAHLMMGLVNNETRPGDPNNYPLNWLRDGAYVVVALARAGQREVARQLSEPFAENDFFGGFGSEADAPGLALWALEEVAGLERDPKFDQYLLPHIQRKVALVEEMLSATHSLRKPYAGPIVPAHRTRTDIDLVCDAAQDGLITGKMDWHRPVLYINAVAYRGLVNAAALARRVGKHEESQRWRQRAAELRRAWNEAFAAGKYENERNYICPLYPTFVASDLAALERALEKQAAGTHDDSGILTGTPLWTYFNVARAHQWMLLGQPDKTWKDFHWFLDHQASPGLYTWWEGNGEENNFGRWEQMARGWVKPPHVTPHYWTAAEMLLMQLDMLACIDETGEPMLVVGAGVPTEWLDKPLAVDGIGTRFGKIDWKWRNGKVNVTEHGFKLPAKLGPGFPANSTVIISH